MRGCRWVWEGLGIGLMALWLPWVAAAELVIPGSGNPEHLLRELGRAFEARHPQHRIVVPGSIGTAGGLRELREGRAVLARIGRTLTDAEQAAGLSAVPLGRDAVVFVAGAAVTVREVKSAQMVDAFAGRITDWRDLGGAPAPIRVIGREPTDASRVAMSRHIPAFAQLAYGSSVKMSMLDPQTLDLLDRFGDSLAVLNLSALRAARTRLVPLALDGVAPDPAQVASGRYPAVLDLSLVRRAGDSLPAVAREFIDFVQSPAGLEVIRANGVVPPAPRGEARR